MMIAIAYSRRLRAEAAKAREEQKVSAERTIQPQPASPVVTITVPRR